MARAITSLNPSLQFVVQMQADLSRNVGALAENIIIQSREPGTAQNATHGAVYLLHIPDPFMYDCSGIHKAICKSELRAHLEILRMRGTTVLILIADVIPDDVMNNSPVESIARLQDLLLLQKGNDCIFDVGQLTGLLESVAEPTDRIVVMNKSVSSEYPALAMELRIARS
jgi:hypothetical protein